MVTEPGQIGNKAAICKQSSAMIWLVILLFAVFLAGCGFHLAGTRSDISMIPVESIYIDCSRVSICEDVKKIIVKQHLIKSDNNQANSEYMVRFLNERSSRDSDGFNRYGRISSIVLLYSVDMEVWRRDTMIYTLTQSDMVKMQYNDSTTLANHQNETQLWNILHQNVVRQLLRRLEHVKYDNHDSSVTTK